MKDKSNNDMIFVKYRKFEAGAKGRWAITALLMVAVYLAGKSIGLWELFARFVGG